MASQVSAQNADSSGTVVNPASTTISQDQLNIKIDELKNKTGMDDAAKTPILNLYRATQENLDTIKDYDAKAKEFEQAITQEPIKTQRLQKELEQTRQNPEKTQPEDFSKIPDTVIEQKLSSEKDKANAMNDKLQKVEEQITLLSTRPEDIRSEIAATRQNQDANQKKQENPASPNTSALELEARKLYLSSQADLFTSQLNMLSFEARSNQARLDALKAEALLLNLKKSNQDQVVSAIENQVSSKQQQETLQIQQELTKTEKTLADKPKAIQQLTRENIAYNNDLQAINSKIKNYTDKKNTAETNSSQIESNFKSAQKKIDLAGLSPVLGKILRKQRRSLPTPAEFAGQSEMVQSEIAQASLQLLQIEDKQKSLAHPNGYIKQLMTQQGDNVASPPYDSDTIKEELRELVNIQTERLNKLSGAYSAYIRSLGDYDFAKQQMLSKANKFANYLDEHLLWVPSSEPINASFFVNLYISLRWFFSPHNIWAVVKDIGLTITQNPFMSLLTLIGIALLSISQRWAQRQLAEIAEKIGKIQTDDYKYTLFALGYTVIMILPLPMFLYCLGWFLHMNPNAMELSRAAGQGFQNCAVPLFALQFMYQLFSANGIAVRHFEWQQRTATIVFNLAKWLRWVIAPAIFVIACANAANNAIYGDTLGRFLLLILLFIMAFYLHKILTPKTGVLRDYFLTHPDSWITRTRYFWCNAIAFIPLVIAGFAIAGYYLSALELQQKLAITIRLVFFLILVYGLVTRWLAIVNRKIALKNAHKKRMAAVLAEKQSMSGDLVGDDPMLPVDEQLIDIPTINAQTIKLLVGIIVFCLIIGIWMIWSNILPAFSFLDHIVLWQQVIMQDNQRIEYPVTLTNLIVAGLYMFIMIVSVRNFSGVMEILVFSHITVGAGARYAVNQLAKYGIISVGLICIAQELGGNWAQVQWLVAALGVGLGFGLQEIFANLVSGIILLFERPIRVGDTVTIGNVTGKVSRIQMRATTLLDFDQKELVVPNKTFITSQFVNWTLSNSITRIVVAITLGESTDVELACKVLTEAIKETPHILDDPAPSVAFIGFTEKGLEFSLRMFVGELSNRLPVTHNLNLNLDRLFRENEIEVPFSSIRATKLTELHPAPNPIG